MGHVIISLRIPEKLAKDLKLKAAIEYTNVSAIIRKAIALHLQRDALRDRKLFEAALGEEITTALLGNKKDLRQED
jgi:Arc/MetJ-type ribon-helix-helix transcriptional regulator